MPVGKLQHTIQIGEQERLLVGKTYNGLVFTKIHWEALATFHQQHQGKYYQLLHHGIKFRQYVGVLRVGNLTIEVLPKADTTTSIGDGAKWQWFLLDMLRWCRLLKLDRLQDANLRLKRHSILDIYLEWYVEEIEHVLRRGLLRSYQREEVNSTRLKGQLLLPKQVQHNFLHKERFYTRQFCYEFDNALNRILWAALGVVEQMAKNTALIYRVRQLQARFPKGIKQYDKHDFQKIQRDKRLQPYEQVLDLARLLLFQFSGDVRTGAHSVLALLFDMNLLFEEYIYQALRRLNEPDLRVKRQLQKPFWERRHIQPDILLEYQGKRLVIDTKWKVLQKPQPSIEDLKQIFIYGQYFGAKTGVLLYPQIGRLQSSAAKPYHPFGEQSATYYCQIAFAQVLKNGYLNRTIGQELFELIRYTEN